MNCLYIKFCFRNFLFVERKGKILIVVYLLGSVIVYDILIFWDIELRYFFLDFIESIGFFIESL